jgi:hypothetical protein
MLTKKNLYRISTKLSLLGGAVLFQAGGCLPENFYADLAGNSVDTAATTAIGTAVAFFIGQALGAN